MKLSSRTIKTPTVSDCVVKALEPVEFLRDEFAARRTKNPAYSLRAFARHIGISPARLSQVLNRKRPLTRGQVLKITTALALDPSITSAIELGARLGRPGTSPPLPDYERLRLDIFRSMADWHHSAILCLLEIAEAKAVPMTRRIASRLGISVVEAQRAVERLLQLGLLRGSADSLKPTYKHIATPSDIPSPALRQLHAQMLDLAKVALETQTLDERDVTSMTMAIDKSKLPQAKQLIKEFRRHLCALLEDGTPTEVYALNVQLFQLSK